MQVKEVIVVEGRSDTIAIQRALNADTIETNGSAIGEKVLKQIKLAQERRGVIIFTDPDHPGQRIRQIVSDHVPGCKHAFLTKAKALSKRGDDLGVENASPEDIKAALKDVKEETLEVFQEEITMQDLFDAGLIAGSSSRKRRDKLSELLNIGHVNGKQLYKRLHKFRVTKDEFVKAMKIVFKEEKDE